MVIQELSMPPTFQPQFLPETDAAELEPFRVSGPVAIKALLRDLIVRRALIALYARNRFEEFVVTQLVRFGCRVFAARWVAGRLVVRVLRRGR